MGNAMDLFRKAGKQIQKSPTLRILTSETRHIAEELERYDKDSLDSTNVTLAKYFLDQIWHLRAQTKEKLPFNKETINNDIVKIGTLMTSFGEDSSLEMKIKYLRHVREDISKLLENQKHELAIENQAYGFDGKTPLFGIKPSKEQYALSEGFQEESLLVDMDLWLGRKYSRDWLVTEYVKGIRKLEEKGKFQALCFIEKREGPIGPIFLASSILRELGDRTHVVIYRPRYQCEEEQIEGNLIGPRESICIIYDLLCTGIGLQNATKALRLHGAGRCGAVVLFDYKLRDEYREPLGIDCHVILDGYTKEKINSIIKTDYEASNEDLFNAIKTEITSE